MEILPNQEMTLFNELIDAILHETLQFLAKHKDFFATNEGERAKKLESLDIPASLKTYLSTVSGEDFVKDLKQQLSFQANDWFKALLKFLVQELGTVMDAMHETYNSSMGARQEALKKLFPKDDVVSESMRKLLIQRTYQELSRELDKMSKKFGDATYLLVQSPREIDLETKKEIREHLSKTYPLSFATFQINRKLIGGFRLFKDGQNIDHSWLSRVLRFTTLKTS